MKNVVVVIDRCCFDFGANLGVHTTTPSAMFSTDRNSRMTTDRCYDTIPCAWEMTKGIGGVGGGNVLVE